MRLFECCIKCKAPKRHPNCHSECDEYKRDRALLDKRNAVIKKSKELEHLKYPSR